MFLEKLQEWYGKKLKNLTLIYQSKDTFIYLVETEEGIEFVRIFTLGNKTKISIDRKIPITKDTFQIVSDCVKFAMGVQKWL